MRNEVELTNSYVMSIINSQFIIDENRTGKAAQQENDMTYIKRAIEDTVTDISKMFPVLLLTGPRQVGKTTLLQNWLKSKGNSV